VITSLLDLLISVVAAALLASLATGWARPEDMFLALIVATALRLWARPLPVPDLRPRRVVAVGVIAYACVFTFVTVTRHVTFDTHALDLGYYVQLVWSLATGRGPWVSLPEMNAWGDHLSPIVYLLVPVFWVTPGPVALLVAQSVALALGGVATFALARRRLGDERPAAAFAVLYLLNPSLHGINVRDFHAAALAIPLLLAALAFAEARRFWLLGGALVLTLGCREDAALPVAGVGAWLALRHGYWLGGPALSLAALATLAVLLQWVIPSYRHEPYSHLWRYTAHGQSLGEIAGTLVLHPIRTLRYLVSGRRLVYLAALGAPLAFLPLRAPADLVGAAPALLQNLLSSDPILFHHRTQYQAFVLPFLVLAAIAGYDRLATRRPGRWPVRVLVVAMLISLALASRTVNQFAVTRWIPSADDRAAHAVLARVPPVAAVSAHEQYVPHIALRPLVFVFPVSLDKAEYVMLHGASYPWRNLPGVTLRREGDRATIVVAETGSTHDYVVVAEGGPHLLLRRQ
jgi:uncharacterized membrane protein